TSSGSRGGSKCSTLQDPATADCWAATAPRNAWLQLPGSPGGVTVHRSLERAPLLDRAGPFQPGSERSVGILLGERRGYFAGSAQAERRHLGQPPEEFG